MYSHQVVGAKTLTIGIHILDVLARPIDRIPTTQNSVLVDDIRVTAAGTAAGTAVDLARLGVDTTTCGVVGADPSGEMLMLLLRRAGVDTGLVRVDPAVRTAMTILPIDSKGNRPAWHMLGSNRALSAKDLPWDRLDEFGVVHVGGVGALPGVDGPILADFMANARAAGALVTADCLGVKRPDTLELLESYLPSVHVFMPNDAEALRISGRGTPSENARAFRELGADCVVIGMGGEGALVAHPDGFHVVPAFPAEVVDTTGCGDALSAGVIAALRDGADIVAATRYGCAAAALTAEGLGSDGGDLSPQRAAALVASATGQPTWQGKATPEVDSLAAQS